jgi:hypothetical protein
MKKYCYILFALFTVACGATDTRTRNINVPFGTKVQTNNRHDATDTYSPMDAAGNNLVKECMSYHSREYGIGPSWDYCSCLSEKEAHIGNGYAVTDCRYLLSSMAGFGGGFYAPPIGGMGILDPNVSIDLGGTSTARTATSGDYATKEQLHRAGQQIADDHQEIESLKQMVANKARK